MCNILVDMNLLNGDLIIACGFYSGGITALGCDVASRTNSVLFVDSEAHPAPVTSLALSKKGPHCLLLSASASENEIHVYSVDRKKQLSALTAHVEGVTDLYFHADGYHMLSASLDQFVIIWRLDATQNSADWEVGRSMKARQHKVASLAIHPSGKLALSVGKDDSSLRVWNLLRGRMQFGMKIHDMKHVKGIRFSESGSRFCTWNDSAVHLWSMQSGEEEYKLPLTLFSVDKSDRSISDVQFVSDELLFVASGRSVYLLRVPEDAVNKTGNKLLQNVAIVCQISVEEARVKDFVFIRKISKGINCQNVLVISSTSAEGSRIQAFLIPSLDTLKQSDSILVNEEDRVLDKSLSGLRIVTLAAGFHEYVNLPSLSTYESVKTTASKPEKESSSQSEDSEDTSDESEEEEEEADSDESAPEEDNSNLEEDPVPTKRVKTN